MVGRILVWGVVVVVCEIGGAWIGGGGRMDSGFSRDVALFGKLSPPQSRVVRPAIVPEIVLRDDKLRDVSVVVGGAAGAAKQRLVDHAVADGDDVALGSAEFVAG